MKLLQAYISKKYLYRMLLSITLLMLVVLSFSSFALHYASEKRILQIQREANRKVMGQISHNIAYMQEIVNNAAAQLYADPEIIPLLSDQESDAFATIQAKNKISKVQESSAFLHSILVYNGHFDRSYAFGKLAPEMEQHPMVNAIVPMLQKEEKLPQMTLLPMNLSGQEDAVDFFSLVMYEYFYERNTNESVIVFNVKPEWIFDNLKAVNDFASPEQSGVFILAGGEQMLLSGRQANIPELDGLKQAITDNRNAKPGDFGFFSAGFSGHGSLIVTYMLNPTTGWTLISVQPYDAVLGDLFELRMTGIAIIISCMGLGILLSIFMARKLYAPIERMMNRLKSQLGADWATPKRGYDELSLVSDVYSDMVQKLFRTTSEQDKQKLIVRNYHLRSLLANSPAYTAEEFNELVQQNGLNVLPGQPMALVIIKVDHYEEFLAQTASSRRTLYLFAISNISGELLAASGIHSEFADMRSDHMALLLSAGDSALLQADHLRPLLVQLQEVVQGYYKLSLSLSLGEAFTGHGAIAGEYSLTLQRSMFKLLFGPRAIITPEQVQANLAQTEYALDAADERKLTEALKSGDVRTGETMIDRLLGQLRHYHYDHILHGILHVTDIIKSTVREIARNRVVAIPLDLSALSRQVLEKESLEEISELLKAVCRDIRDTLQHSGRELNSALVDAIKDIITANYKDKNLSLQSISDMLMMSPAYVGVMFKQSEYLSVSESITEVRLAQAREYLETKNFTIREIMELTGFVNESTFFKLFKKRNGITPKEYRLKKLME